MPKPTTIFACSKCGAQSPKWQGRCLSCGAWGTLAEELIGEEKPAGPAVKVGATIDLSQLKSTNEQRFTSGSAEIDRVLGGGLVPGSFLLLGGDPGIGKSTLALQLAKHLADILYVSGEESAEQVKLRLDRIHGNKNNPTGLKFLPSTKLETIIATAKELKPKLLIIDSIQTMQTAAAAGAPGSVTQITAAASQLMELAKTSQIAVLIIGHVTKDGLVAGPKTLEHLVDTVMYLENDQNNYFKILRAIKNRFGATGEIGVFEMTTDGLKEVSAGGDIFLDKNLSLSRPGIATTVVLEGSRPFLVEIQALTTKTFFGYPIRKTSGFDLNRLQMILAVIGKYANVNLGNQDVYLNVAGGLKIKDTAADLAAALAIVSSSLQTPLPAATIAWGEIGLSGEIRSLPQSDRRLKEATRLGFTNIIAPGVGSAKIQNLAEAINLFKKLDKKQ